MMRHPLLVIVPVSSLCALAAILTLQDDGWASFGMFFRREVDHIEWGGYTQGYGGLIIPLVAVLMAGAIIGLIAWAFLKSTRAHYKGWDVKD